MTLNHFGDQANQSVYRALRGWLNLSGAMTCK